MVGQVIGIGNVTFQHPFFFLYSDVDHDQIPEHYVYFCILDSGSDISKFSKGSV